MTPEELEIAKAACCVGTIWDEYEGTKEFNEMVEKRVQNLIELVRKYRPSLPSNLDDAAEETSKSAYPEPTAAGFAKRCFFKRGFKAGSEWMAGQGVSLSHLIAWYIQSVDAHEPIWTEKHLEELVKDYILIPKK